MHDLCRDLLDEHLATSFVHGPAEDFCLLVTQRRHLVTWRRPERGRERFAKRKHLRDFCATSLDSLQPANASARVRERPFRAIELFMALRHWPGRIDVSSRNGSVSMPLCLYPATATHDGNGPVTTASSYRCR